MQYNVCVNRGCNASRAPYFLVSALDRLVTG